MGEIRRISVEEATKLLDEGYVYVDVRSEPEFEAGHVPGAFNVPISHQGSKGLTPNPDFLSTMERAFDKDERLLIGCKSGARSLRAATELANSGYKNIVELRTGWDGTRDAFGRFEPGYGKRDLPIETGAPEGRRYSDTSKRRG